MAGPNRDQRVRNPQKPRFRAANGPVTPRLARDMANLGERGPGPGPARPGPGTPQFGPNGPEIRVLAISRARRGVRRQTDPTLFCLKLKLNRLAMVSGPNWTVLAHFEAPEGSGSRTQTASRARGAGGHFGGEINFFLKNFICAKTVVKGT